MERRVSSEAACPFCRPGLARVALLASKHYLVIPDEYPRGTGHLLLVARTHLIDHRQLLIAAHSRVLPAALFGHGLAELGDDHSAAVNALQSGDP